MYNQQWHITESINNQQMYQNRTTNTSIHPITTPLHLNNVGGGDRAGWWQV